MRAAVCERISRACARPPITAARETQSRLYLTFPVCAYRTHVRICRGHRNGQGGARQRARWVGAGPAVAWLGPLLRHVP